MGSKDGARAAPPIIRPTTEAFSFGPPEELNERMMLCTAWAYLRRGALLVREVCAPTLDETICTDDGLVAAESLLFANTGISLQQTTYRTDRT